MPCSGFQSLQKGIELLSAFYGTYTSDDLPEKEYFRLITSPAF